MIVVAGTAQLQAGVGGRAQELIEGVVRETRKEPGCLSYTFYVEAGNPEALHVFEEWESIDALNVHLQQEHTQRFLTGLGELVAGPPDVKRYEVSAVASLF